MKRLSLVALVLCSGSVHGQTPRELIRLDDPFPNPQPYGSECEIEDDGSFRMAVWQDDRDMIVGVGYLLGSVSFDRGVTWSPEFFVNNANTQNNEMDLVLENGNAYVSFRDDLRQAPTHNVLTVLRRSQDQGATWTDVLELGGFGSAQVHAEGDDVFVASHGRPSGIDRFLHASFSSDEGDNWGSPQALSFGELESSIFDFSSDLADGVAYCIWREDTLSLGNQNLYFRQRNPVFGWGSTLRVDGDLSGLGQVQRNPQLVVDDGRILVAYLEEGRNGVAGGRAYFTRSDDGGSTWTETPVSLPGLTTDRYLDLAVDGDLVVVAWFDQDNPATDYVTVAVSRDGGLTFDPPVRMPEALSLGVNDVRRPPSVYVDGGRILVTFETEAFTPTDFKSRPAFCYSVDAGMSWNGPAPLVPPGFDLDTTISSNPEAWNYADGSLIGFWRVSISSVLDTGMYAGGIRFPFIDAFGGGSTGPLTFSLGGADTTVGAPSFARWAASSVVGVSSHPENPLELLELGSSFELSYTLSRPNQFAAPIQADGTASLSFNPGPISGTYYIQGWVNVGPSITGGTTASDVITIVL